MNNWCISFHPWPPVKRPLISGSRKYVMMRISRSSRSFHIESKLVTVTWPTSTWAFKSLMILWCIVVVGKSPLDNPRLRGNPIYNPRLRGNPIYNPHLRGNPIYIPEGGKVLHLPLFEIGANDYNYWISHTKA
jgi:hypothetical protein